MSVATQKIINFLFVLGQRIDDTPSKMDRVVSLELLDLHCKMLPGKLLRCRALRTLDISGNQLTELPLNTWPSCYSSECSLQFAARFLDLNVNNLHAFPPKIGGCQSLAILSLRHNNLSELPMEIGKLNQLQVLDLADNSLQYLPYTLTVLCKAKTLSALWLSFNQPPLPNMTTTHEPVMNIKFRRRRFAEGTLPPVG
ncbi:hypothetical protein niasHT_000094 [Heterodera trifolii]|uniref:Uncharacterized protein n=1 Tax=Heterodera trifolii TaxID=157864 RepID=A0ABD2M4M1_9BILA